MELTAKQKEGIDLLYKAIEAQIALFNFMNPECPMTMEEVLERLSSRPPKRESLKKTQVKCFGCGDEVARTNPSPCPIDNKIYCEECMSSR